MLENILETFFLSLLFGISCHAFYDTILTKRIWRRRWAAHTVIPAFMTSLILISISRIPAYIWQPIRLIVLIALVAQIYFQTDIGKNLILAVTFCVIYWLVATCYSSFIYLLSDLTDKDTFFYAESLTDNITILLLLFPMLLFRSKCKKRVHELTAYHWKKFAIFPFAGITVITAINIISWNENDTNQYARMTIVLGLAVMNIAIFYFMIHTLEKEKELQTLRLRGERTLNQMEMYHTMQKNYDLQRQRLHDYKNQLICIQGLLDCGQTHEAQEYISRLTGTLKTNMNHIHTNHSVVNVILNQKYQSACDRNITMSLIINDLSTLTMSEEDLVTLLANVLDNAIEACEKLSDQKPFNKIIQFKMLLEDNQLILSVRNPVDRPVPIKHNTIVTSKNDTLHHGIGLLNVDTVIQKNKGIYVLQCEQGWFCFSAMIPIVS